MTLVMIERANWRRVRGFEEAIKSRPQARWWRDEHDRDSGSH